MKTLRDVKIGETANVVKFFVVVFLLFLFLFCFWHDFCFFFF